MNQTNNPTEKTEQYKKLVEILQKFSTGMLSTVSQEGLIRSRPMTLVRVTEHADTWFMAAKDSDLMDELTKDPRLNLILQEGGFFMSLSGMAEVVTSKDILEQLWDASAEFWSPQGVSKDDVFLIRMLPFEGQYWDVSGLNRIKFLFEKVLAKVTGTSVNISSMEEHIKL